MESEFAKRLDDLIRRELLVMGHEYARVVRAIEPWRGEEGATVRLHPPYEDLEFDRPEEGLADETFAARVARRLKAAIEAPERPPAAEPE